MTTIDIAIICTTVIILAFLAAAVAVHRSKEK